MGRGVYLPPRRSACTSIERRNAYERHWRIEMVDLRAEFRRAEDVPAPDLSNDIRARVTKPQGSSLTDGMTGGRRRVWMAAAVVVVLAVVGSISADLLQRSDGPDRAQADASWLTWSGVGASCVERFSVKALASRSWAFDGTIVDVVLPRDPESGGPGDTITVKTYSRPGELTSNEDVDGSVGARILAAGEDDFIWGGCGFSKPHTAENAALFATALRA